MRIDLGGGLVLRRATADDHAAMNRVCLLTGDAGRDSSTREDDPELLGLIYATPYQVFAPDFAFVVEGPDGVCGYVLGAPDTAAFNRTLAAEWYPALRGKVTKPPADWTRWRGSDPVRHMIHTDDARQAEYPGYPAHGHIDLLPEAQGRGIGRIAMRMLEERLRAAGASGVYMQVDKRNADAQRFYAALGYNRLPADITGDGVAYGKRL